MDLEKYSIKRLREIVKLHNKNIRKSLSVYKKLELKKHIIKVSDYKTKGDLVKRMKESQKDTRSFFKDINTYKPGEFQHSRHLRGIDYILEKLSNKDSEHYSDDELNMIAETYNIVVKKHSVKDGGYYLKSFVPHIIEVADSMNIDRNFSASELIKRIKGIAKTKMKQGKKDDKLDAEVEADYDKATTKPQKVKTPKQPKYNKIVKKIAESKPAEQVKQIKELVKVSKKVNDKTSKVIGKSIMGQFAIDLNKSSNPEKVLEQLIKQYQEKNMPKKVEPKKVEPKKVEPKKVEPKKVDSKATASKKLPDSDQLFMLSSNLIEILNEKINKSKTTQFGKDFKKFNKSVSNLISEFKAESKKRGVNAIEIDRFFQEILTGDLMDLAQLYINVNKLKDVHVMETGKIMENGTMKGKTAPAKKQSVTSDKLQIKYFDIFEDSDGRGIIYDDPENNIFIEIDLGGHYKLDKFGKLIYIDVLNSQEDRKKERARPGLTRNILCQLLHYALKKKLFSKTHVIGLTPGDLGSMSHNQEKLTQMYKKMGFKEYPEDIYPGDRPQPMQMSLDNFFKWCDSKHGTKYLEILANGKGKAKKSSK